MTLPPDNGPVPPRPGPVPPPPPPRDRRVEKKEGVQDWVKEHIGLVIIAAVVIFGLLIAIGTGVVHMPGQREPASTTAPS